MLSEGKNLMKIGAQTREYVYLSCLMIKTYYCLWSLNIYKQKRVADVMKREWELPSIVTLHLTPYNGVRIIIHSAHK